MSTDAKKDSRSATVGRVSPRVESLGPGKNVLMPDIYAEEFGVKETPLEIVDESSPDIDESSGIDKSAGFNPYDTGTLYKK